MELRVEQGNIAESDVDLIVINLFAGVTAPGGATGAIDRALNGAGSRRGGPGARLRATARR